MNFYLIYKFVFVMSVLSTHLVAANCLTRLVFLH